MIGLIDVGNEVDLGTSPEHLGDRELVGTILATGCEQAARSKHGDEEGESGTRCRVERGGVPDVASDRVGTVFGDDLVDSCSDVGVCIFPRSCDKSIGGAALRFVESGWIVMNLTAQHALVASESLGDGMIVVGTHLLYCPVVSDIDDNAAAGLA